MEGHEIITRLYDDIKYVLGYKTEITPQMKFADDLGCDSLDQVELIMRVEDNFDIEISDEDAMKIHTVQQAIDYLSKKVGIQPKKGCKLP